MKFNFSSINLWCNKNLVDLEFVIGSIFQEASKNEIQYFIDPEDELVEYLIINTCWFLSSSREEAEETITYYDNLWKKLIIIGCYLPVGDSGFLSNLQNLYKIIPFKDLNKASDLIFQNKWVISDLKNQKLDDFITNISNNQNKKQAFIWNWDENRAFFNADYSYEYLKIAEWCDNNCTFCIIPKIRWKQKSKSIDNIIKEAQKMIEMGIKEIILIAQDTTRYWVDLYWKPSLVELLEKLEELSWDFKYRVLYMYPDNLTLEHLEKLKNFPRFIPYFDIPFQHISENILKKMWRYYNTKAIFEFLDYIVENFPVYHLRTAFIIGFPWETNNDFLELKKFIQKYKFDSVALFEYHDEPLAASSNLSDKIPHEVIIGRINKLDKAINQVYIEKQMEDKWKEFIWYITDFDNKKILIRRELKAPEIDELDEIKLKNFGNKNDLGIWKKVKYTI